ncbi:heavy metal-binding domain-containing protein [Hymenobacter elongatus]|uniref:Heavy metal binding domain-containing protein n=1 Tax=Hymenobacter elongatus TaxID=877208 RepID=A0A4Z0PMZ0_9BACT|nr:heavy metal-binding domain-containing protein [Hymenobacter elongatus]TGE17344.1 hypothetical protein E5J99_07200 [Hymenobacter elongatus]
MKVHSFLSVVLFVSSALLSGCGDSQPATTATTATPSAAAAPDSAAPAALRAVYECPMSCEGSRSASPGKCPVCAMELERKS